MKVKLLLQSLSIVFIASSSIAEAPFPEYGTVVSTSDTARIEYTCTRKGVSQISCEMKYILVSRETEPSQLAKKTEIARQSWLEISQSTGHNRVEQTCNRMKVFANYAIVEGFEVRGVDELNALPELERLDLAKEFHAISRFCQEPSLETFLQVFEQDFDRRTRTCKLYVSVQDELFDLDPSGAWIMQSNSPGICSKVSVERFERDPSSPEFWNYFVSEIVLNPQQTWIDKQPCARSAEERTFTWQTRSLFKQCDYISF